MVFSSRRHCRQSINPQSGYECNFRSRHLLENNFTVIVIMEENIRNSQPTCTADSWNPQHRSNKTSILNWSYLYCPFRFRDCEQGCLWLRSQGLESDTDFQSCKQFRLLSQIAFGLPDKARSLKIDLNFSLRCNYCSEPFPDFESRFRQLRFLRDCGRKPGRSLERRTNFCLLFRLCLERNTYLECNLQSRALLRQACPSRYGNNHAGTEVKVLFEDGLGGCCCCTGKGRG